MGAICFPMMNKRDGWIKVHRTLANHWVAEDAEYLRGWLLLLMAANYQPRQRMFNGSVQVVETGQILGSSEYFGRLMMMSPARARRFVDLLQKHGMITKESTKKGTKLTICNYETYQDLEPTKDEQASNKRRTENNTIRSKEIKKGRTIQYLLDQEAEQLTPEVAKGLARFTPPSRDEAQEYGKQRNWRPDEVAKFYDYQESSGWRVGNKPMKNWQAAMRTWEKNMPPRYEEVAEYMRQIMFGKSEAETILQTNRFFGYYEKQGWRTGTGQRIVNFKPLAVEWIQSNRI